MTKNEYSLDFSERMGESAPQAPLSHYFDKMRMLSAKRQCDTVANKQSLTIITKLSITANTMRESKT